MVTNKIKNNDWYTVVKQVKQRLDGIYHWNKKQEIEIWINFFLNLHSYQFRPLAPSLI